MIKFENVEVTGWEAAVRGMRNPMNSWEKSDSFFGCGSVFCDECPHLVDYGDGEYKACDLSDARLDFSLGENDLDLMKRLISGGPVEAKFRRMITVHVDITAPLYWWKEFDTYKVGTVANSCSTMHKIHSKEFTLEDFSHEHLIRFPTTEEIDSLSPEDFDVLLSPFYIQRLIIDCLNHYREKFLKTKDKKYWWQMIQLLPTSYNQRRTVMLNYEVLANIYKHRINHKLDEWRELCKWIEELPYSQIITGKFKEGEDNGD